MYLLVFLYLYGLVDYYFTQWILIYYYLYFLFFDVQIVPDVTSGSLFKWF